MNIQLENGNNIELSTEALNQLATKELVDVFNAISDTNLKNWKSSKAKLMSKILEEANVVPIKIDNEIEQADNVEKAARKLKAKADKAIGKPKKRNAAEKAAKKAVAAEKRAAKAAKAKEPREPSKGLQVLMRIAELSGEGQFASLEELMDYANTSAGSVRSYVTYYRNGQKGFPQIPVALERGKGFILDKADIVTADSYIQNWK